MAKKPKSAVQSETPVSGHNEDSRKVLFFMNRQDYAKALAAKKSADAALKNVCKTIKADLGEFGLEQIKAYDQAQTPEGQAKIKARIEADMQALRFAGMPVGTQLDLLVDRMPAIERAARDGYEAGLRGDTLANPYNEGSPEGQTYAEEWHRGQGAIFAIRELRLKDEAAELIKGSEPSADNDDPFEPQREAAE